MSKDIEKRISGKGRQGGSMNIRFSGFSNSLQSLNRRQSLTNILLNKQNVGQSGKKDLFVRSTTYDAGTYTISAGQRRKMIPGSVLAAMNNDISKVRKQGDIYECGGTFFTAEQIPKISGTSLNEIKAEDNIIDFGKNKYFKYVSGDGQEHCLYTDNKGIGSIVSEIMRGEPYDPVLERYASFWNYMMTKDPVYVQLSYSDEEIRGYMENAGIKNGFFTVKMGDREATQFYSATKTTSPIQSKERYDARYKNLTSGGILLDEYEAGDIFKIGNKEYVLSESHTLDIPYGEDIYNIDVQGFYWSRKTRQQQILNNHYQGNGLEVPVIILAIEAAIDSYYILTELRKVFASDGYNAYTIGMEPECVLYGLEYMPEPMADYGVWKNFIESQVFYKQSDLVIWCILLEDREKFLKVYPDCDVEISLCKEGENTVVEITFEKEKTEKIISGLIARKDVDEIYHMIEAKLTEDEDG